MTATTILSVWPEDERDRKRSPARSDGVAATPAPGTGHPIQKMIVAVNRRNLTALNL